MTFEQCVYSNHSECSLQNAFKTGAIPYFCGHAAVCRQPTIEAVVLAKKNVNRYFGVVALTEDIMNGLVLLEQTTPSMFEGLTRVTSHMANRRINSARGEIRRSQRAMEIMEKRLELENHFYAFVKQRYTLFKDYFQTENFRNEIIRGNVGR